MEGRTGDDFLTHERVTEVYGACLAKSVGHSPHRTIVEGWAMRHTFVTVKLHMNRENIVRMLLCLPRGFRTDERGGGSVMMMPQRDDGAYWTSDMSVVERLVALGMALGLLEWCSPRGTWDRLPGGVPYVRVCITRFGVSVS